MATIKGLRERMWDNESIICAEGYMTELERRGFLKYGPQTPEVVLDHPDVVRNLHEEFVLSGSDVVQAFTYYAHRAKVSTIEREIDLEQLNRTALRIARDMADKTGTLMAGGLCNTTVYDPNDPSTKDLVKEMFKEQVEWAVEEGADYIIAETFSDFGEAKIALEAIQEYSNGLPSVVTLVPYYPDVTTDDIPFEEALSQLELLGADVVGLNCGRGPETFMPLLKKCREFCKGPMAALPVPFRTTDAEKSWMSLKDSTTGKHVFPLDQDCCLCSRSDIRKFAQEARDLGIQYIGLCCGASANMLREVAIAYGRQPTSAKYTPDMEHFNDQIVRSAHDKKKEFYKVGRSYNYPVDLAGGDDEIEAIEAGF